MTMASGMASPHGFPNKHNVCILKHWGGVWASAGWVEVELRPAEPDWVEL